MAFQNPSILSSAHYIGTSFMETDSYESLLSHSLDYCDNAYITPWSAN